MSEVKAGQVYEVDHGKLVESTREPTLWICRRVEDFPPGAIAGLAGIGFAICPKCHAPIAFNTARKVDAEKVCMQCAGIEPMPWRP